MNNIESDSVYEFYLSSKELISILVIEHESFTTNLIESSWN